VRDLSPLRGLKLKYINVLGCLSDDFSPLAGMPIDTPSCPWVPFLLGETTRAQLMRTAKVLFGGRLDAAALEQFADVYTVIKLYADGEREAARTLTLKSLETPSRVNEPLRPFARELN
jgi:hypothetical protein